MKPNTLKKLLACVALFASASMPLFAQLKTLGIGEVKIEPSVLSAATTSGNRAEIERVTQAMDGQLIAAISGTRKFQIAARSDLGVVVEEQALSGGAISAADYLLVPSVDDFQDIEETATFAQLERTVTKRTIRFSTVAKIYDTKAGKLLEAANIRVTRTGDAKNATFANSDGNSTDAMLLDITREMAEKIALRVMDIIYPAKVIAKTGKTVTINRGDGGGIEKGQVWQIYAVGEALVDPDTGEILGQEEVHVGSARITSVLPKFSKGEVIEDLGVDAGAVMRLE